MTNENLHSLKLYGCLSFPPTLYLHIKARWFKDFQHHACQGCWKPPCKQPSPLQEPLGVSLKYTAVDSSGYIYGGVDKAGYLKKTSVTNKPSLSFFFKKNHPTFPDSGHMPFPLCAGMEVTRRLWKAVGRRKLKSAIEKVAQLDLQRLMDKWWLERGYAYLNCILSLLQSNDITKIAVW